MNGEFMKKSSLVLGSALIILSSIASAYEMNGNSWLMVREGLKNGPRAEMANCSLPEDFGLIINKPDIFVTKTAACLVEIRKIKTNKSLSTLSSSCQEIEMVESLIEFEKMGASAEEVEYSRHGLVESLQEQVSQVKSVGSLLKKGDAVLLSSVLCESDKSDEDMVGTKFIGAITGKGISAKMKVLSIGK
jgi:hypothetical protein